MTILDWLQNSMIKLRDARVDSPRRDCLVLVEDLLGKDRSWINAHGEYELSLMEVNKLNKQIERRVNREPLAYIRGKSWFYGRFFEVKPSVMIPRPESETFIKILKEMKPKIVFDIGTGSGCLAITAKLELPNTQVFATDISPEALKVAQKNISQHKVDIKFVQGYLMSSFEQTNYDSASTAIIANLPYVPDGLITSKEINFEPEIALFSGKDGLNHYREFWQQIYNLKIKPKYILTESLENQHTELKKLTQKAGYSLEKTEILVQLFTRLERDFPIVRVS